MFMLLLLILLIADIPYTNALLREDRRRLNLYQQATQ